MRKKFWNDLAVDLAIWLGDMQELWECVQDKFLGLYEENKVLVNLSFFTLTIIGIFGFFSSFVLH